MIFLVWQAMRESGAGHVCGAGSNAQWQGGILKEFFFALSVKR